MGNVSFSSAIQSIYQGTLDSMSLHRCFIYIYKSKVIRKRTLECIALNGVIFLGSMFVGSLVVFPMLRLFIHYPSNGHEPSYSFLSLIGQSPVQSPIPPNIMNDEVATSLLVVFDGILQATYYGMWILPIYLVAFFLNLVWYQEISVMAYKVKYGRPPINDMGFSRSVADFLYTALMICTFIIFCKVMSYIPVLGPYLVFIFATWLYSFYAFEYVRTLEGLDLEQRVLLVERNWPYFWGFGVPITTISYIFPYFVSSGIYAFLFPLFIILATNAKNVESFQDVSKGSSSKFHFGLPSRLPIFSVSLRVSAIVVSFIKRVYTHRESNE